MASKVINLGNTCGSYSFAAPVSVTSGTGAFYLSTNAPSGTKPTGVPGTVGGSSILVCPSTGAPTLIDSATTSITNISYNQMQIRLLYTSTIPAVTYSSTTYPIGDTRLRILYSASTTSAPTAASNGAGFIIVSVSPAATSSITSFTVVSMNTLSSASVAVGQVFTGFTFTTTYAMSNFYVIDNTWVVPTAANANAATTKKTIATDVTVYDLNDPVASKGKTAAAITLSYDFNTSVWSINVVNKPAATNNPTLGTVSYNTSGSGAIRTIDNYSSTFVDGTVQVTIGGTLATYKMYSAKQTADPNPAFNANNLSGSIFNVQTTLSPAINRPVLGYNGTTTPVIGDYLALSVGGIYSYLYMFNENYEQVANADLSNNSQFLLLTSDRLYYLNVNTDVTPPSLVYTSATPLTAGSTQTFFSTYGFWSIKTTTGTGTSSKFNLYYTPPSSTTSYYITISAAAAISLTSTTTPTTAPAGVAEFTCTKCTISTVGGACA